MLEREELIERDQCLSSSCSTIQWISDFDNVNEVEGLKKGYKKGKIDLNRKETKMLSTNEIEDSFILNQSRTLKKLANLIWKNGI